MGGQEELHVPLEHGAHGPGPLQGIALHLLRIAAVGEVPDEEVPGADGLVFRDVGPGVVVRFPLGVDQLEVQVPDLQIDAVLVGRPRTHRIGGEEAALVGPDAVASALEGAELPFVDGLVVAVREGVAIKALFHVLVAHPANGVAVLLRVCGEKAAAPDVIDVAVGIDHGMEGAIGPLANCRNHPAPALGAAGVEDREPGVAAEAHGVAKGLHHGDVVIEDAEFVVNPV